LRDHVRVRVLRELVRRVTQWTSFG
jgi:hypothetical protein